MSLKTREKGKSYWAELQAEYFEACWVYKEIQTEAYVYLNKWQVSSQIMKYMEEIKLNTLCLHVFIGLYWKCFLEGEGLPVLRNQYPEFIFNCLTNFPSMHFWVWVTMIG